jgi:hypothetical protein
MVAPEQEVVQTASQPSPFTAVESSPFKVVDEAPESRPAEFGRPVKLPERRKMDSPFQMAEPSEGFGFEAPAAAFGASPFEAVQAPPAPSPFAAAPAQQFPASPFAVEPQVVAPAPAQPSAGSFKQWPDPAMAAAFGEPKIQSAAPPVHVPSAFAPAAPAAPQAQAEDCHSDSYSIRQLELRAIFGVDRELGAEEILQRARALPGIRNLSRLGAQEIATVEGLKNLLPSLGFSGGPLKLYSGSIPLEFIREGSVLLAVQTDGSFAPGVRETLMIIARELGRLP